MTLFAALKYDTLWEEDIAFRCLLDVRVGCCLHPNNKLFYLQHLRAGSTSIS